MNESASTNDFDYIAYTDGGCARNPSGPGGYGVVLMNCHTGQMKELSMGYRSTTNNRMEIAAAIVALKQIPAGARVALYSDSQLMLNCLSGAWKRKVNLDLWALADAAAKDKDITYIWVRGHNGDPMNERCDQLATQAMNRPDLLEDTGFTTKENAAAPKKGAAAASQAAPRTAARPQVPSRHRERPEIPAELDLPYSGSYQPEVHEACRQAIASLPEDPGFQKLVSLRTGGLDGWSRLTLDQVPRMFSERLTDLVRGYLPDNQDFLTCTRWIGRGLKPSLAIRKVLADKEISEKMMKKTGNR